MKKKTVIVILALLVCVLLFAGCTPVGQQVIIGNDLKYKDLNALQEDWTLYTAGEKSTAAFTYLEQGIKMSTSTAGFASARQKLVLQPHSYYEISYRYTTTSMTGTKTDNYRGLYIGFLEDENFNVKSDRIVEETSARTNNRVSYYIHTNEIREVTLCINFGSEEHPVSGTATVYEISLKRVQKSAVPTTTNPAGETVLNAMELRPTVYNINSELNITYVVLGAVAIALIGYVGYLLYVRYLSIDKKNGGKYKNKLLNNVQSSKWKGLLLATGIALGVRLLIAIGTTVAAGLMNTVNMGFDMSQLVDYAEAITGKGGTIWFVQYHASAVIEPLKLYLAALSGGLARICGGSVAAYTFFIKFFAILADVGVVAIIYKLLHKRVGNLGAVIVSLLYAFLPITFAMSSTWGIWTSITAFLIVLTFYFILEKKYIGVAISYFAACMFSFTAIYFAPVILVFTVRNFIKSKKDRIPTVAATGLGFALFYALSVPFTIQQIQAGQGGYVFQNYWDAMFKGSVYSQNAFNFQSLLGNNFKEVSTESIVITAVLVAFIVVLVAVQYFKNPNRLDLVLLGGGMITLFYTFTNNMTPDLMLTVLPLMFIFAFLAKEKRVYFLTIVYSVMAFINNAYVYTVLGYTDAGITAIPSNDPLNYVFGAIWLVIILYSLYLFFDVLVDKKAAYINPMDVKVGAMWKYRVLKVGAFLSGTGKKTSYFFKTALAKSEKGNSSDSVDNDKEPKDKKKK